MSLGIRSPSHRRAAVCISQSIVQEESTANDTDRNNRTSILTSIYVGIGVEPLKEYRRGIVNLETKKMDRNSHSVSVFPTWFKLNLIFLLVILCMTWLFRFYPYTFSHLFPNCFVYVIIYLFISMLNYDFCWNCMFLLSDSIINFYLYFNTFIQLHNTFMQMRKS